jgi:hypothetical protein
METITDTNYAKQDYQCNITTKNMDYVQEGTIMYNYGNEYINIMKTITYVYENEFIVIMQDLYENPETFLKPSSNILYRTKFIAYVLGENDYIKTKSLLTNDITNLIQNINNGINKFATDHNIDKSHIHTFVSIDVENKYLMLTIFLLEPLTSSKYINLVKSHRMIPLDRFEHILNNAYEPINLVAVVQEDDDNISVLCEDNWVYASNDQKGGTSTNLYDEIKALIGTKNDIVVLNIYAIPDKRVKGSCMQNILVRHNNIFYTITFESTIFNNKHYLNDLMNRSLTPTFKLYNHTVYLTRSVWNGIVTVQKVPDNKVPIIYPIIDNADAYNEALAKFLHNPYIINTLVIVTVLINLRIQQFDIYEQISKYIKDKSVIATYMSQRVFYTNNFYIIEADIKFKLWYNGNIANITNMNIFTEIIKITNELDEAAIDNNMNIFDYLKLSTDYYTKFQSSDFVYNSRHLKHEQVKEIALLLRRFKAYFVYTKLNNIMTNRYININESYDKSMITPDVREHLKKHEWTTWAHYPNGYKYYVFHMHIVQTSILKNLAESILVDIRPGHQPHITRNMNWDYIRKVNLRNVPILTTILVYINFDSSLNDIVSNLHKFIYEKIPSVRPTISDEDIISILNIYKYV